MFGFFYRPLQLKDAPDALHSVPTWHRDARRSAYTVSDETIDKRGLHVVLHAACVQHFEQYGRMPRAIRVGAWIHYMAAGMWPCRKYRSVLSIAPQLGYDNTIICES